MIRGLFRPVPAGAVLLGSASFAGWCLSRALLLDAGPVTSRALESSRIPLPPAATAVPVEAVRVAVEGDPFRPDRRRPAVRFRMPGEPLAGSPVQPAGEPPFRLIGTAVLPAGRGFAMCQMGEQPPRLVRLGERVGDLVLKRVHQGRATFESAEGRQVELRVPKAGT